MTDNEIIKALECCTNDSDSCEGCPLDKDGTCFGVDLDVLSLDLINRQKAEIERYNKGINELYKDFKPFYDTFPERVQEIKVDAIKEFAEKVKHELLLLKKECRKYLDNYGEFAIDKARKKLITS